MRVVDDLIRAERVDTWIECLVEDGVLNPGLDAARAVHSSVLKPTKLITFEHSAKHKTVMSQIGRVIVERPAVDYLASQPEGDSMRCCLTYLQMQSRQTQHWDWQTFRGFFDLERWMFLSLLWDEALTEPCRFPRGTSTSVRIGGRDLYVRHHGNRVLVSLPDHPLRRSVGSWAIASVPLPV